MNVTNKYNIAFKGLGAGEHKFEFEIDDSFFKTFEDSEIKGGKACAEVNLQKTIGGLSLDFDISGTASVECDRCLEICSLPLNYKGRLTVKFTDEVIPENEDYDGEILWLNNNEGVINIAQYIYESIVLSLPFQRVHPEDENGKPACDPDMLKRFKIVSEDEFETLTSGEEQKMENNPEWDKLRQLKDKM